VGLFSLANLSKPQLICTIKGVREPHFVSRNIISGVSWTGSPSSSGAIFRLDLPGGAARMVAARGGNHAWSRDGGAIVYLAGGPENNQGPVGELHLKIGDADRVLATLPAVGGRGGGWEDSIYVGFSADGGYLAMVTTISYRGQGEQAPFQVRRLDGTLVASSAAVGDGWGSVRNHALWAGNDLYFRQVGKADVMRLAPPYAAPTTPYPGLRWFFPSVSPDGTKVAYETYDPPSPDQSRPQIGAVDLQGGRLQQVGSGYRSNPHFIGRSLLLSQEVRPCQPAECGMVSWRLTGRAFVNDLANSSETTFTWPGFKQDTLYPVRDVWIRD
jgi:hypothetical protein